MTTYKVISGSVQFGRQKTEDKHGKVVHGKPLVADIGQTISDKQIGKDSAERLIKLGVLQIVADSDVTDVMTKAEKAAAEKAAAEKAAAAEKDAAEKDAAEKAAAEKDAAEKDAAEKAAAAAAEKAAAEKAAAAETKQPKVPAAKIAKPDIPAFLSGT